MLMRRYALGGADERALQQKRLATGGGEAMDQGACLQSPAVLAGPLGYFLYRYFIQLGFLDGTRGAHLSLPARILVSLSGRRESLEFDRTLKPLAMPGAACRAGAAYGFRRPISNIALSSFRASASITQQ